MKENLRIAIIFTLVTTVLFGFIYPLSVTGLAQLFFPAQANGSLITRNGHAIGSKLLGQMFTSPAYFHPRPSAAGTGYDPLNSGGSNLGPTSQKLVDGIKANAAQYRQENGLAADATVPADAVTASGSGLDPHISPENAALQAPRIAKARGLDLQKVTAEFVSR